MRMQPVTSGQRATRQAADARNLPSYFPSNSANLGGFKTISAGNSASPTLILANIPGAGTNGQVRILPKSTESDEMRIQPFPSGQRVTRRAVGDAQILPYFPNGKTSRPKTMPFPSGNSDYRMFQTQITYHTFKDRTARIKSKFFPLTMGTQTTT